MKMLGTENLKVQELSEGIILNSKWLCKYYIELCNGARFYFTNITKRKDIETYNFTLVMSNKEKDYYILAPDMVDPFRESFLIVIDYTDQQKYVRSIEQNGLIEILHDYSKDHTLICMIRAFPEIYYYPALCWLLKVYTRNVDSKNELNCIEISNMSKSYIFHPIDTVDKDYIESILRHNKFIMHSKVSKNSNSVYYTHPATRFVLNECNIIFANPGITIQEIQEWLCNTNIPPTSIIWDDYEFIYDKIVNKKLFLNTHMNAVFMGYPYDKTCTLRREFMLSSTYGVE